MRFFLPLLLLCLSAQGASAQTPAPGDVVVNEILYDPPPGQPSGNEWIEVVNRSAAPVDLAGLVVTDGTGTSEAVPGPLVVAPGGFAVFARSGSDFAAAFPGVPFTALGGFPSLNNSGDRVAIRIGGVELDAVPYTSSWGGRDASLERKDPDGPSASAANFATSTAPGGGTPGATNSVFQPDTFPPEVEEVTVESPTSLVVTFSEPVEEASAETPGNYRLAGGGTDAPASQAERLADPATVRLTVPALRDRSAYVLTVSNVADLRGNRLASAAVPFFVGTPDTPEPGQIAITEILYDPAGGSNGEYVEILNATTDRVFDLAAVSLDGDPIAASAVLLDPGQYVAVARDLGTFRQTFPDAPAIQAAGAFSLSNSGDTVTLASGSLVLDAVTFSPGWHRPELDDATGISLERRDPAGPSNDASNWTSSVDPRGGTPGEANSVRLSGGEPGTDAGLTVGPPFFPDDGEAAEIGYRLSGDAALLRVRIFDGAGRLVREVVPGRLAGTEGTVVWDGRADTGDRARVGIYVVLLEALDVNGGTTEAHRAAVVVGRR